MATGLTLDSGALIGAEKNDRHFWILWREAIDREATVTVPAAVLAQIWRGKSHPLLSRVLAACVVEDLTQDRAKVVGKLLAKSRSNDVIDAAVVAGAVARADAVVTSDPADISRLAAAAGRRLRVIRL
jgi:predicted nucleic acid-binding protein